MLCWYTLILLPSSSDSHKLFMKCLAIEKRKCGGYFQTFLQSLEDKVKLAYRMIQYTYVYCILEYNNDQFIMIDCCADCVCYMLYTCVVGLFVLFAVLEGDTRIQDTFLCF